MSRHAGSTCLAILSFLFYLFTTVVSETWNVTVDDAGSDPLTGRLMKFSSEWAYGPSCESCEVTMHADFDLDQVYNRTWHDTTFVQPTDSQSVEFTFNGSAVYVYGILPHNQGPWMPTVNLSFTIDGKFIRRYSRPTLPNRTTYDILFFVEEDLAPCQHTILIENGADTQIVGSIALLDYMVYTHVDPPTAGAPTPPIFDSTKNTPTKFKSSSSISSTGQHASSSLPTSNTSSSFTTSTLISTSQTTPIVSRVTSKATTTTQSVQTTRVTPTGQPITPTVHQGALIGSIVGGVIGGMAIITVITLFFIRHRKQKSCKRPSAFPIDASPSQPISRRLNTKETTQVDLSSLEAAPPAYNALIDHHPDIFTR